MVKNFYLKVFFPIFLTLSCIVHYNSYAQIINKESNVLFLKEQSVLFAQQISDSKNKALAQAKEKGWPTFQVTSRGDVISLQGVDDLGLPIYYITQNNSIAAATTNTNKLYAGGSLSLSLSGSTIGNRKIAIWDGGAILTDHIEFSNRILKMDNATSLSSHSTHVAGTMIAAGVYAPAKGMAFALPQLLAFDFNSDISEMSANATSLLISNHSYGSIAGWRYNDDVTPARWEFWGAATANEDFKFGYYNADASNWDLICFNAPFYLPVKSAGNSRNENGPAVGEPYYRYNAAGVMTSAGNRPAGIYSNDGYDIISTYGNAKNILTVGAINPLPYGPTSTSSIQITSFSSWGPTDDGRIKPDIVGDGSSVTSTTSSSTTAYATLSGTSMATPNISGSLVLLQELYSQKNNGAFMRSATLKALVLGTATEAGANPGPDYIYGWGLLNAEEAAKAILNKGTKSIIAENTLAQGASQTVNVIASGNGPLIVTICWTDPPATAVASAAALDNPIARLINDLDLRVNDNTTTFSPWILNPANPSAAASTGDNFRDNVEQVYIANAIPGKSYTITINHKGTLQNNQQAYAIVATGVGGAVYCASAPTNNADSKITNLKLANIDNSPATNCTTYSDFTSQTINLEKGKTYPLSLSLGTCGSNFDKIAKVFIDYNSDGDFDDANELVATSNTINGTGTFTSNITIPDNVTINNFSLLRVVLTETGSAANVTACGSYAKGETQDYRVKFQVPAADVGAIAVINPSASTCANTGQTVAVRLKNFGTQSQTNIPISVAITDGATVVATLTGTYTGNLTYLSEADVTLSGNFNALASKTYTLTAKTNLTGDLVTTNDQVIASVQTSTPPVVTTASAYLCNSTGNYSLSATGLGTILWYKNLTDVNPIAFGENTTTISAPGSSNEFYAGINDFSAEIGPKTKAEIGDGGYNQFTPGISIQTLAPITIASAKLYIGNSGQIRFTVVNTSGVAVSSVLLNVTATKSNPGAGPTANDTNDQGQVYPLNLTFPSAGSYTINIEYLGGATIFRNNVNNTSYPYRTNLDLFNITGNTATSDNADYYKTFYYYLYDIKLKSAGCLGGSRLNVPISVISITENNGILSSSIAANYQWYLDGVAISGATNQQYTPTKNGKYTVEANANGTCTLRSAAFDFTLIRNPASDNEINLKTYPVPTDGELNIAFDVAQANNVSILMSNLLGQVVYKEEKINFSGSYTNVINLARYASGVYILRVKVGSKVYTRKITVVK